MLFPPRDAFSGLWSGCRINDPSSMRCFSISGLLCGCRLLRRYTYYKYSGFCGLWQIRTRQTRPRFRNVSC